MDISFDLEDVNFTFSVSLLPFLDWSFSYDKKRVTFGQLSKNIFARCSKNVHENSKFSIKVKKHF